MSNWIRSIPRAALFESGLPDVPEPLSVLPTKEYLDNVPEDDKYYLLGDINSSSYDHFLVRYRGVHGLSSRAFLTYLRSVCLLKPSTLVSGSFSFEGVFHSDLPGWYNRAMADGGMFIHGLDTLTEDLETHFFPKCNIKGVYCHQSVVSFTFPLPNKTIRVNLTIEEFKAYAYDGKHTLSNVYMKIPKRFIAHGSFEHYESTVGKQNVATPIRAKGTLWIDRVPKSAMSSSRIFYCPSYNWVKVEIPFKVGHCFYNVVCLDENDRVQPVYVLSYNSFVVFVKSSTLFFYLDVGAGKPKRYKAKFIPIVTPTQLLRYSKGCELDIPVRLRNIFVTLHSKLAIESIVDVFSGIFPLEWSFVAIVKKVEYHFTGLVCPESIQRPLGEAGLGAIITTSRNKVVLPFCSAICEHVDSTFKTFQTLSIAMECDPNPYARSLGVHFVRQNKGDVVVLIAGQLCVLNVSDFSLPKRKLVIQFPGCGKPRDIRFVPFFSNAIYDLPIRDCGYETFSDKRYKENGLKSDFYKDFYSRLTYNTRDGPKYAGDNPYGLLGSADNPGSYLKEVSYFTGATIDKILKQDGFSRNDKYFVSCEPNVSQQRNGANCYPWCTKHPGGNGRWVTCVTNAVPTLYPNKAQFCEYGGHVSADDRSDYGDDHCEDEECNWAGAVNEFNDCSDNPPSYYDKLIDDGGIDVDEDTQFYMTGGSAAFVASVFN
jgi:hypothetical protein